MVAGFADTLLNLTIPTRLRSRRQSQTTRQFSPVGKTAPAKQLLDQDPGTLGANGAKLG